MNESIFCCIASLLIMFHVFITGADGVIKSLLFYFILFTGNNPVPNNSPSASGHGQVKVTLQYKRGQLEILVQHARHLALLGNVEPSPYAKLYLLPDPLKKTKRKTRVHRKTCHPTFMEPVIFMQKLAKYIVT